MATDANTVNLKSFYDDRDPEINEQTRKILTNNGIPKDELVSHVRAVRDKVWAKVTFPCIGRYAFLEFSIGKTKQYEDIHSRLKDGATLLDMGCCFGQDLRKLVYDGAPGTNLTGAELEPVFIELGYELFKDRKTLKADLIADDIFSDDAYGLQAGTFDFVHAGSFFDQFTWQEQTKALAKCLRLLKPQADSMLLGRQIAAGEPGTIKHAQFRSGEAYNHDTESWRKLVAEVTDKLGLKVNVDVELMEGRREAADRKWRMMRFSIELQ